MKYATPLFLEPGPSRLVGAWLIVVHVAAILLIPFMGIPIEAGVVISVLALFSLWRAIRLHARLTHPDSIKSLRWNEACSCQLRLSSGRDVDARLMPQVFMLPWLVIMRFKSERRRLYYLLVLPGMLETDAFRRLRVRLMIGLNRSDV